MSSNDQLEKVFVKRIRPETSPVETLSTDIDNQSKTPAVQTNFHLFHWYFLVGYYTLIIPFKIRKRHERNGWEIRSWVLQKWLSLICWWPLVLAYGISQLIRHWNYFFDNSGNKGNGGACHNFDLADFMFGKVLQCTFYWMLVSKRGKLVRLFNDIRAFSLFKSTENLNPPQSRVSKWTKWFLTVYIINIVIVLILLDIFKRFVYEFSLQATITSGRKRFFLSVKERDNFWSNEDSNLDTDDRYLAENIIVASAELVLKFIGVYNEAFILMCFFGAIPLTFWYASKRFQQYLYTPRTGSPTFNQINNFLQAEMILEKHEELRNLMTSLNSIWSTSILYYIFGMSLGIIVYINGVITSADILGILHSGFVIVLFLVSLVFLAEGRRMNASMKLWLWEQYIREQVFAQRRNELEWLERYLDIGPVGIGEIGSHEITHD